jgi:UPF0489 domain
MYDRPFEITDKRSNNAFSFDKRTNPTLWVPDAIEGNLDNVEIGDRIVFEDFDENGVLKSCVGLRHFVRMRHPKTGKPIVIVDNHNHVFYFWHDALSKGQIKKGATLVHIDQHKDMRKPDRRPMDFRWMTDGQPMDENELRKIFEYTNTVLNVGNYIAPVIEDGLIGKLISVTSEREMDERMPVGEDGHPRLPAHPSTLLNIDLDFWAPEMDYIPNDKKTEFTRKWMEKADLITIATSPFFIDPSLAIGTLKKLFSGN